MQSPPTEHNTPQPAMLLRYASYHGSAAETMKQSSGRLPAVKRLAGVSELEESDGQIQREELSAKEGRKFLLLQKFPDKHLSKQRKMSTIAGFSTSLDSLNSGRNSLVLPNMHSFGMISDDGFNATYNQDALLSVQGLKGIDNTALFGVFDGHGVGGDQVAHFAKDHLYKHFLEAYGEEGKPSPDANIPTIIEQAFHKTQDDIEKNGNQFLLSGTTASIALLQNRRLFIANIGDSRVVLGRECMCCLPMMKARQVGVSSAEVTGSHIMAISTTVDHRAGENKEERERIEKAGGTVIMDPNLPPDAWDELRIYAQGQTYPGLVTSRTLGDVLAHGLGVISTPDISSKIIDRHDKILILASDGVWDILSSQEAINLVSKFEDPVEATNALIAACVKGWSDEFDAGDNVSAIVLFLNNFRAPQNNHPTCTKIWTWQQIQDSEDAKEAKRNPTPNDPPNQQNATDAQGIPKSSSQQPVAPLSIQHDPNAGAMIPASGSQSSRKPFSGLCTLL